jgi:hypothetical protein
MSALPHDVADLHLPPLLLTLDTRLEEMGHFDSEELSRYVATVSDQPDWTRELRAKALLTAVERFTDCHGWTLSWHPRGIQVHRRGHQVVLGVPANFAMYLLGQSAHRNLDRAAPIDAGT